MNSIDRPLFTNKKSQLYSMYGCIIFLVSVTIAGLMLEKSATQTNLSFQNRQPSFQYPFGTDWLGRNMLARTLAGISLSIRIGLLASIASALISTLFACLSVLLGKRAHSLLLWIIDFIMGIPHILLLILISFACGKGFVGVMVGIVFTHWMSLARLINSELLALHGRPFVQISQKLGRSKIYIIKTHFIPHILPHFFIALVLLFPHAVLHEASITFLGFGLPPEQSAIGIILSEGMRYLMLGKWWLTLFPGAFLVITVILFDHIAHRLKDLHRE
ncbi:MAG: ABC transporter permease [Treponemataceae bacterium]